MASPAVIMSAMETDLLVGIIKNLSKGNIGSAEWQAINLRRMGKVGKELEELIIKGTEETIAEAQKILARDSKAAVKTIDDSLKTFDAVLPDNADTQLLKVLSTWEKKASVDFGKAGAALFDSAKTCYLDIVETVTAQTLTGQVTGRQAMAEISRKWSKSGLKALTDKAGREWTTEAYAQTIIRSNVRNVTTDIQQERTEQYGLDLVEVSSHVGAREKCEPYQGKIYSLSGKTEGYPLLAETSHGEIDGLFGINCQHEMYPYIPGTKSTFKPVKKRENDKAYKNSQKQRNIERSIRRAKREKDVAIAAGDKIGAENARLRVNSNQAKMREFIDDTGRTRYREREQIFT